MNFEIAKGTITGAEHARVGRNNQDATCVRVLPGLIVVVVCDGCSSGVGATSRNEVGAALGADVMAAAIVDEVFDEELDPEVWERARGRVLYAMDRAAWHMGARDPNELRALVMDKFLFTITAAIITPKTTALAAIGDSPAYLNGARYGLGPFEGGAPSYLAYALLGSSAPSEQLTFAELQRMPTGDLTSFLVGTDGVDDLAAASGSDLPNGQPVGPIDRLWTEDRFFRNPDALRRHLVLANGGIERRTRPILTDDTTIVVGRRVCPK